MMVNVKERDRKKGGEMDRSIEIQRDTKTAIVLL